MVGWGEHELRAGMTIECGSLSEITRRGEKKGSLNDVSFH